MKPAERIARILAAASEYRINDYERGLIEAREHLPPAQLVHQVLAPLLREAGDRWQSGELSIVQEHMLSSAVRRQLDYALDRHGAAATGPAIAFTTLSGERHELGSLMLAVVTASRGFRSLYLGADLPVDDGGRLDDDDGRRIVLEPQPGGVGGGRPQRSGQGRQAHRSPASPHTTRISRSSTRRRHGPRRAIISSV